MIEMSSLIQQLGDGTLEEIAALLEARDSIPEDNPFADLYDGASAEVLARAAESRHAHYKIRARRLMLPTLTVGYHRERAPLQLKLDARLAEGEHAPSMRYLWVDAGGEIACESRDFEEVAQWAWDEGYRRAGAETWTLNLPASTVGQWLTPNEAAAMTGTASSGWRNRAAAGKIPGAVKKGSQWLIPAAAVVMRPRRRDESRRTLHTMRRTGQSPDRGENG